MTLFASKVREPGVQHRGMFVARAEGLTFRAALFPLALHGLLMPAGSHMLAAMFSGRMEVQRDADGKNWRAYATHAATPLYWLTALLVPGFVNIDRDGSVFRYVLNHLRDGETVLPASRQERRLLLAEARFYALQSLVEQIIREDEEQDVARCRVAVIRAPGELQELVGSSKHGKPVVVFVYNRSNNKFSYTGPSDGMFLHGRRPPGDNPSPGLTGIVPHHAIRKPSLALQTRC